MSAKSRKRKGKYQPLQSKRKKGRQSPPLAVSRQEKVQETVSPVEDTAAIVAIAKIEPTATPTSVVVKIPELIVELRRIGVLATVALVILIMLALVLD